VEESENNEGSMSGYAPRRPEGRRDLLVGLLAADPKEVVVEIGWRGSVEPAKVRRFGNGCVYNGWEKFARDVAAPICCVGGPVITGFNLVGSGVPYPKVSMAAGVLATLMGAVSYIGAGRSARKRWNSEVRGLVSEQID
jgi:hypothetical protein